MERSSCLAPSSAQAKSTFPNLIRYIAFSVPKVWDILLSNWSHSWVLHNELIWTAFWIQIVEMNFARLLSFSLFENDQTTARLIEECKCLKVCIVRYSHKCSRSAFALQTRCKKQVHLSIEFVRNKSQIPYCNSLKSSQQSTSFCVRYFTPLSPLCQLYHCVSSVSGQYHCFIYPDTIESVVMLTLQSWVHKWEHKYYHF